MSDETPDLYQLIAGLNAEQQLAVTTTEGPVLILAGPGSGKTRTVTFRIAYLIDHERVRPWNILAVTFTNKAAREMRDRLEVLVGPTAAKELHVGTFHSICARVLRGEMENLDAGRTRSFTILDDDEQLTLIKTALRDLNLDDKRFQPRTMHNGISRAKNELLTAREFAASVNKYFDEIIARVYARYDELLRAQDAVDFDDLILLTHRVWQTDPDALRRAQNRYHYIHVDEFQDCNRAQYELVRLLALGLPETDTHPALPGRGNICVVGDEDQCLVAGTQITMADGTLRPIETIRAGDQVLSNYGSGDMRPAEVLRATRRDRTDIGVRITTQGGHTLTSTAEHVHFAGDPRDISDPQTITVTLCADPIPHHYLALGQGAANRASRRQHESRYASMAATLEHAEALSAATSAPITYLARLGKNGAEGQSLPFTPAASVQPGMLMFTADGGYDRVAQVERVPLTEPIYDLDIARTHNFIANGIITHNSIYAWRGASSKNILGFERDFPQRQLIILARNYRSTQTILDAAMSVVRQNPDRVDKELWTDKGSGPRIEIREVFNEEDEGKFIADTVRLLAARGEAKLSECAVLYRTNAQSRAIEEQMLRASVPYRVIGSRKFYERKEIRDVVAYLRLIANPRDTLSLARIINVPARKIGEATVRQLLAWAEGRYQTPEDAIRQIDEHPTLATTAKEALRRFGALMTDLRATVAAQPLDVAIDKILEKTGYAGEVRDGTDEGEERWRNVLELRRVASDYSEIAPESALALFLENVALIGGADTASTSAESGRLAEEERDAVTLITLHAAKGLEFPIVFMVGMEEGVLPHSRSMEDRTQLEEERRLTYVGITRAMKRLYLVRAFRRSFYGGSSVVQMPSRFLGDIPANLVSVATKEGTAGNGSATRARPNGEGTPPRSPYPSSGRATRPRADEPAPYVPRAQRHRGTLPPLPEPESAAPPREEAPPAPPSEAAPRIPIPGDKVRHRIFGPGIVLKVTATIDSTEVEVLFDRTEVGKKTLDLNFAKLDVIG